MSRRNVQLVLQVAGRVVAGHVERAQVRALTDSVQRLDEARAGDAQLLVDALDAEGDELPAAAQDELCRGVLAVYCERRARVAAAAGALARCRSGGGGGGR